MATPESLVKLVRSESERLEQYLAALPPEAWTRPSGCDRWEVRDVVAHLVFWAEVYANSIARGVQGECSPPEGWPPAGSRAGQPFHAWSAQTAIAHRESLGEQLLPTFRATNDQLNQVLMRLGPQDWEKRCYHPVRLFSVQELVENQLVERVMHGWDIRSRLEPAAPLPVETLPAVSDVAGRRGINVLGLADFRPSASHLALVCYHFALTDLPTSGYDIVIERDTIRMVPAATATPNVTLRCDAETFVLVMLGRLKVDAAIADRRLAVDGDRSLAHEFIGWLKRS